MLILVVDCEGAGLAMFGFIIELNPAPLQNSHFIIILRFELLGAREGYLGFRVQNVKRHTAFTTELGHQSSTQNNRQPVDILD
jgi:hypothetical protein